MARRIAYIAIIAATYVVLTFVFAPISYGFVQFRISEVMTILPYITPLCDPWFVYRGIFRQLGQSARSDRCRFRQPRLINRSILNGQNAFKMACSASSRHRQCDHHWDDLGSYRATGGGVPLAIAYVGLGQLVVCYGLGLPILHALLKRYGRNN